MKKRFPFRLGTTSYILHDDILPNVRFLKDKVDNIELLLFETDEDSNYPSAATVKELNDIGAEYDLTYTVHLPIYIQLGTRDENRRRKNVETILRAIDATRALNPPAWELHLEPDEYNYDRPVHDWPAWQDACIRSLEELKAGGADPARIGVETLEYDFTKIEPVLDTTGFGICLDIGHIWLRGFDETFYLSEYLPRAISFHVHGFDEERDHKGLQHCDPARLDRFLSAVSALPDAAQRVVTIEVFSENEFQLSMETLTHISAY